MRDSEPTLPLSALKEMTYGEVLREYDDLRAAVVDELGEEPDTNDEDHQEIIVGLLNEETMALVTDDDTLVVLGV